MARNEDSTGLVRDDAFVWQVWPPGRGGSRAEEPTVSQQVPGDAADGLRNAADHANGDGVDLCWIILPAASLDVDI
jgi:hypothetical protein